LRVAWHACAAARAALSRRPRLHTCGAEPRGRRGRQRSGFITTGPAGRSRVHRLGRQRRAPAAGASLPARAARGALHAAGAQRAAPRVAHLPRRRVLAPVEAARQQHRRLRDSGCVKRLLAGHVLLYMLTLSTPEHSRKGALM